MTRYVEDEEVLIIGGKYKEYKRAIFVKYAGRFSCVIRQISTTNNNNTWTVRLKSIKKVESRTVITVDKAKYELLLQNFETMETLMKNMKNTLDQLKLDEH